MMLTTDFSSEAKVQLPEEIPYATLQQLVNFS